MTSRFADHILGPDTHANLPSATATPAGALYECTTHNKIYRNSGTAWVDWATLSSGIVQSVVAGTNVTVDSTDPAHPIVSATGGGSATFAGAAASRSAAQSIAHAGWAAVQLNDTDTYDTDSIHDPATNNTRFTIPTGKGGKWRFTGTTEFAASTTGVRAVGWKKNGVQLANQFGFTYRSPSSQYATVTNTSVDLLLSAGDYIEHIVYQESGGGALNLSTAYVTCQYLG